MSTWTSDHIPDQTGRTAVVTGANAGIGYETALALAKKGAHVVLACRSEQRGTDALRQIEAEQPAGSAELMLLDLADLDSVRTFAEAFWAKYVRLDLLINNAGVMVPPESKTAQGFELQFGVNVIGHFALTGLLMSALAEAPGSRVVTLSSLAHRQGRIDFDNLRGEKEYKPMREYMQSKLGDLIFAIELQRRLEAAGQDTISLGAHPGFTATELQRHSGLWNTLVGLWSNTPAVGALPTLYAATAPDAEPGGYYGPRGVFEARGHPAPAKVMPHARDRQTAERLWAMAEEATGVHFFHEVLAQAA
ncbi:MAG: SDR family NAD(P)-dependent oxidoreductase [Rhodothermaceae bacterium]|nr:SDR family NAD(P)-dependent oxidoreductase [Rhodothermaceae bacterium]